MIYRKSEYIYIYLTWISMRIAKKIAEITKQKNHHIKNTKIHKWGAVKYEWKIFSNEGILSWPRISKWLLIQLQKGNYKVDYYGGHAMFICICGWLQNFTYELNTAVLTFIQTPLHKHWSETWEYNRKFIANV